MNQSLASAAFAVDSADLQTFQADTLRGLRQYPKQLPPKYFYDSRGSALFDAICELEEYYVTRTELAIMRLNAAKIARCLRNHAVLIELGSGSSIKTRLLLNRLAGLTTYVPIDISRTHLLDTASRLQERYGQLDVRPVVADFTQPIALPPLPLRAPRAVYFPGSTIGNFQHGEAICLMRNIAALAGSGGALLIGIDLQKDPAVIEAAYNDRRGITAEFNCNLLRRINRELGADFQLSSFTHEAPYDVHAGRIEMRLRCHAAQTVRIADESFRLQPGETILTEYSHKYTVRGFADLASQAGFVLRDQWLDDRGYFALLLMENEISSARNITT